MQGQQQPYWLGHHKVLDHLDLKQTNHCQIVLNSHIFVNIYIQPCFVTSGGWNSSNIGSRNFPS